MNEETCAVDTENVQDTESQSAEYPHWFRAPTTIEEAQYRVIACKAKVAEIVGQIEDITRRDRMMATEYLAWRAKAKKAQSFSSQEVRLLSYWITQENKRIHAAKPDKGDHQERLRVLLAQAERMGPVGLINALYLIVKELRNTNELDLTPEMWAVMDAARAYCESITMQPDDVLRSIEVPR